MYRRFVGRWRDPLQGPHPIATHDCRLQRPVRLARDKAGMYNDRALRKRSDLGLELSIDDDSGRQYPLSGGGVGLLYV